MKLCYLIFLLVISTAASAIDLHITNWFSSSAQPKKIVTPTWLASQIATTTPIFLSSPTGNHSFDVNAISFASSIASSFSSADVSDHHSILGSQSLFAASGAYGYFTEFQLPIKNDLLFTGQWTRVNQLYNDGFDSNSVLPPVEWSLATESRASSARAVGLNWTILESWQANVKLQTVNGSAWIPQVSVPRFVTQDSEDWALAAVEVVYSF